MDSLFLDYIRRHKAKFSIMVTGMVLSILISVPIPMISKFVIDDILIDGDYGLVKLVCFVFFLVIVLQTALLRLNAWISSSFSQDFIIELRRDIALAFLKHSQGSAISSGNAMVVLSSDVPQLSEINMRVLSTLCNSIFASAGYMTMLIVLNFKLAFLAFAVFPFYFIWVLHVGERMKILTKKSQEINEELLHRTEVIAKNIETIQIYHYRRPVITGFERIINSMGSFLKKVALYSNFVGSVSSIIATIGGFAPLIVGVYFVSAGEMTVGDLVAFNTYCGMLLPTMTSLIELLTKQKVANVHSTRIKDALARRSEASSKDHPDSIEYLGVEIDGMSLFSRSQEILRIDYVEFEPKSKILITGNNGEGKTLLLKTIAGLYKEYTGQILLHNTNIKDIDFDHLSDEIVYVSSHQGFVLETVREELFSSSNLKREETEALIEKMDLLEVFERIPEGLDAPCEKIEQSVNTGILQKIRILRALSRNPSFLILDEVFSNIQSDDSRDIIFMLDSLFPNLSLIVVEHHFRGEGLFDRTYEIKDGEMKRVFNER